MCNVCLQNCREYVRAVYSAIMDFDEGHELAT